MGRESAHSLSRYLKKRDFTRTPEPRGHMGPSPSGHIFVIQKHAASHLHYDFRLEWQGVLKSWAVPKGLSIRPGDKRLAVATEDHPIAYADFEGTIAEGYGAGKVEVWDRGEWEPLDDPDAGLRKGKLSFRLHGRKVKGLWTLVRLRQDTRAHKDNWLLIKSDASKKHPPSHTAKASKPKVARRSGSTKSKTRARAEASSTLQHAEAAPLPTSMQPALATLVDHVPEGDNWLHEEKYDGYRLLAVGEEGQWHLLTRKGHDWSQRLPALIAALAPLKANSVVLDGELISLDAKGRSHFQNLQNSFRQDKAAALRYALFDIPYLNGFDLTQAPLRERRQMLELLFTQYHLDQSPMCMLSNIAKGHGQQALQDACQKGWEGLICKRLDSPYRQERTMDWVKVKCHQRQEFVVAGYTAPKGRRRHLGSLILAYYREDALIYAGHVGTGFNDKSLADIGQKLRALGRATTPLAQSIKDPLRRTIHWVSPQLVAEVEFTGWTDDGRLRHPSFKGLRLDKNARDVIREDAVPAPFDGSTTRAKPKRARAVAPQGENEPPSTNTVSHSASSPVPLTHPERILYADAGITKQDLAHYFWEMAPLMLPHLKGRPIAIIRCPEGQGQACFFQKHVSKGMPKAIDQVPIEEGNKLQKAIVVNDAEGLASLAQIGCLEIHPWACLARATDKADRLTFDLDPAPEVAWEDVIVAATAVRAALTSWDLRSFVKTTGGRGLHVLCPLSSRVAWEELKDFARFIASALVHQHPQLFTISNRKAARGHRIYLDYLRNSRGATQIAPYSLRARPHAPIATPLSWHELTADIRSDTYRFDNIKQRLASQSKDPWMDFFVIKQALPKRNKWDEP